QCVYSAGQLFWLLKIRALYVVSSKRNYFAQRREAALKLPTELATFPEKQKSHDDPVYMLTSREEFSCPALLGRSVTSVRTYLPRTPYGVRTAKGRVVVLNS